MTEILNLAAERLFREINGNIGLWEGCSPTGTYSHI